MILQTNFLILIITPTYNLLAVPSQKKEKIKQDKKKRQIKSPNNI